MRIALGLTLMAALFLAGCQTSPDDADMVPASTLPPGMAATGTAGSGAPSDIADLVNARAPGAETQMTARGYAAINFQGGAAFWWNSRTTVCARVVTANGRFQQITTVTARFCGQ